MKALNRIIMTFAGLFLIVAGILKANQLLTTPIVSEGFWESWLFLVIQVPLEIGLGVWLVSGLFRKAAWIVGTIAYLGFIIVTAQKLMVGAESCGCFGTIDIDPSVTLFAIDIPIFLAMAIFRPRGEKLLPPPWPHAFHCLAIAIPACLVIGALAPTLYFNKVEKPDIKKWVNPTPTNNSDTTPNGTIDKPPVDPVPVDLVPIDPAPVDPAPVDPVPVDPVPVDPVPVDPVPVDPAPVDPVPVDPVPVDPVPVDPVPVDPPDKTVIKQPLPQWPWLESADIADKINTGMAIVLCYRHDCDTCHEVIPKYLEMAEELAVGDEGAPIMAFLAIPERGKYGKPADVGIPDDTKCLIGKLKEGRDDYNDYSTPVVVALQDGVAVGAWEEEAPTLDEIFEVY